MELHVFEVPLLRGNADLLHDQTVERVYVEDLDYDWWRRHPNGDLVLYQHHWHSDSREQNGGHWAPREAVILVHGSYLKVVENFTDAEILEQERIDREEEAREERLKQRDEETAAEVEKLQDGIVLRAHNYCPECLVDLTVAEHIPTCTVGALLRKGYALIDGPLAKDGSVELSDDETEVKPEAVTIGLDAAADARSLVDDEVFGADAIISTTGNTPVLRPEEDDTREKKPVLVLETPPAPIITLPPTETEKQLAAVLDRLGDGSDQDPTKEPTDDDLAKRAAERDRAYQELGDTGHHKFEEVQAGEAGFENGAL